MGLFPFGAPILERGTQIPTHTVRAVVIGAYPSAVHVQWEPPPGYGRAVNALPVDNEPEPFWAGDTTEVAQRVEEWRARYFDDRWGTVTPARLNGPSGQAVDTRYLTPLGLDRSEVFITDVLTTARASSGVARRLTDRYEPIVRNLSAPATGLVAHPSEDDIVVEALTNHADRLRAQIHAAAPETILTLGRAAARVLAALGGHPQQSALTTRTYGQPRALTLDGTTARWLALAHPAAPAPWQRRHDEWIAAR